MSWREVASIAETIKASRRDLRPLLQVRCPTAPSPVVAAVYYISGERWFWTVGDKLTPAELQAGGIEAADWPTVAETVRPLDKGWRIHGPTIVTCRKCRLTWLVDVAEVDARTASLPTEPVTVLAAERFNRRH